VKKLILIIAAAAAVLTALALTGTQAGAVTSHTAAVTVTNRDDSGANGGNWASDNFTRTLTVFGHGIVANTFCPGITIGGCHHFTGVITDAGHFTTVIGNPVPGNGSLNGGTVPVIGVALTGTMAGTFHYNFYANAPVSAFSASNGPASVSGDTPSTGVWPEQFFTAGTQFWDTSGNTGGTEYLGTTGGWTYRAPFGSDSACPNYGGQWVDASPDWGVNASDGNILAPDAAHC
jgi:hypothetical protein